MNEILIEVSPRETHLGPNVVVKRMLPYVKKRTVGPFIFLDHLDSTEFAAGDAFDVRPHPHIGLSTLSYMYEGKIRHRDSLGYDQVLMPRDVNWMTAGRGIVHSERLPDDMRGKSYSMHLLQFWIALPKSAEDMEPRFSHHPSSTIPVFNEQGSQITLIAGEAFGKKSPVDVFSKLFFLEVLVSAGKDFHFNPGAQETAFYVLDGNVELSGESHGKGSFLIFAKGTELTFTATKDTKLVLFGGEPLAEERHIYWNFVSSSKDKIEAAKKLWRAQEFPKIPGETEFIPLPAD